MNRNKKSKVGIFLILFFLVFSLAFSKPAEASWFSKAVKSVSKTVSKVVNKVFCWTDDHIGGRNGNNCDGGGNNSNSNSNASCSPSFSCNGDYTLNSCTKDQQNCSYGCSNGICNSCPNGICPVCNNASTGIANTMPTSNLCTQGSPSSVSVQLGSRAWQWQCSNSYKGNEKSIACSASCGVGKWVCDSKCIPVDSPCNSTCVGSRQLIGKVCAGNDTTNNNTTSSNSSSSNTSGSNVNNFGGFGVLDNSSIPQITLAARVPNGEWKQATPLTNFILTSGKNIELAWAVVNASMFSNCSGSSKFFDNIPVSTGSSTGPLTQSQTFTLTCKNDAGSDTKTVKVIIPAFSEF